MITIKVRKTFLFKAVSVLLAFTFASYNTSFAVAKTDVSVPPAVEKQAEFSVSDIGVAIDAGTIKSKYSGDSGRTIIHIQDAHCNFEAQSNINKILEQLSKECDLKMISVEGAEGIVDTAWFRAFPDAEIRQEVATYFMKKGEITGAEFFSINSGYEGTIFGAETRDYYIKNLKAFTEVYPYKESIEKYFTDTRTVANRLKSMIYPPALRILDSKIRAFKNKELELSEYAEYLHKSVKKRKIDAKDFTNFNKLFQTLEYEKKIDFDIVDSERSEYIDSLSKKLSKKDMTELVAESIRFKKGHIKAVEFYTMLRGLAKEHNIPIVQKYPNLFYYYIYTKLYNGIDNEGLFKEIDAVVMALKKKLFQDETQERLDTSASILSMFIDLVNIELTNDDYDLFQEYMSEYSLEDVSGFIKSLSNRYNLNYVIGAVPTQITENVPRMIDFYEIAMKRDVALINNTLNRMKKEGKDRSVLIAGGFHTRGFKKLLEDKGVSYVVITPKITKDVETPYIKVLTNQRTSLEDIITESAVMPGTTATTAEAEFLAPYSVISLVNMYLEDDKNLTFFSKEIGDIDGGRDFLQKAEGSHKEIVETLVGRWLGDMEELVEPGNWSKVTADWKNLMNAYFSLCEEAQKRKLTYNVTGIDKKKEFKLSPASKDIVTGVFEGKFGGASVSDVGAKDPDERGYDNLPNDDYTLKIKRALKSGNFAAAKIDYNLNAYKTDFFHDDGEKLTQNIKLTDNQLKNLMTAVKGLDDGRLQKELVTYKTKIIFIKNQKAHYGVGRPQIYLDLNLLEEGNMRALEVRLRHEFRERLDVLEAIKKDNALWRDLQENATTPEKRSDELKKAIITAAKESHAKLFIQEQRATDAELAGRRQNLRELENEVVGKNKGVGKVLAITNEDDGEIIKKKINDLKEHIFRKDGKTEVFAHEEKTRRGQFLGLLDAIKAYKKQGGKFGIMGEVILGIMLPGKGTRMSPFTQRAHAIKPLLGMLIRPKKGAPWLSGGTASLYTWNLVAYHLQRLGFSGVAWKWGDEPQVAANALADLDKSKMNLEEADIVRFGATQVVTEDLARSKEWLSVDENGKFRQVRRRERDALLDKLGVKNTPDAKALAHAGSPAFSYTFLNKAAEVFGDVDEKKWADVEGYLVEALTQKPEEWQEEYRIEIRNAVSKFIKEYYPVKETLLDEINVELVAEKLFRKDDKDKYVITGNDRARVILALNELSKTSKQVLYSHEKFWAKGESKKSQEEHEALKFKEPGMHELLRNVPDFYKRAQDLKVAINLAKGKAADADLDIKVIDLGEDLYWGDMGQGPKATDVIHKVAEDSPEGVFARELAGLENAVVDEFGNVIEGDVVYPQDGSVRNSVLINTKIYGKADIDNAVIFDSDLGDATIGRGSVVMNSTILDLDMGEKAFALESVSEKLTIESGWQHTSIPKSLREVSKGLESWRADMSKDVGSDQNYKNKQFDNNGTFEDLREKMRQREISADTIEAAIDKHFREPLLEKMRKRAVSFKEEASFDKIMQRILKSEWIKSFEEERKDKIEWQNPLPALEELHRVITSGERVKTKYFFATGATTYSWGETVEGSTVLDFILGEDAGLDERVDFIYNNLTPEQERNYIKRFLARFDHAYSALTGPEKEKEKDEIAKDTVAERWMAAGQIDLGPDYMALPNEVLRFWGEEMYGEDHVKEHGAIDEITLKHLTAGRNLSVQMHNFPEMFIALQDGTAWIGLKEDVTWKKFLKISEDGEDEKGRSILDYMYKVEFKAGDAIVFPAYAPHIYAKGSKVIEVKSVTAEEDWDGTVSFVDRTKYIGMSIDDLLQIPGMAGDMGLARRLSEGKKVTPKELERINSDRLIKDVLTMKMLGEKGEKKYQMVIDYLKKAEEVGLLKGMTAEDVQNKLVLKSRLATDVRASHAKFEIVGEASGRFTAGRYTIRKGASIAQEEVKLFAADETIGDAKANLLTGRYHALFVTEGEDIEIRFKEGDGKKERVYSLMKGSEFIVYAGMGDYTITAGSTSTAVIYTQIKPLSKGDAFGEAAVAAGEPEKAYLSVPLSHGEKIAPTDVAGYTEWLKFFGGFEGTYDQLEIVSNNPVSIPKMLETSRQQHTITARNGSVRLESVAGFRFIANLAVGENYTFGKDFSSYRIVNINTGPSTVSFTYENGDHEIRAYAAIEMMQNLIKRADLAGKVVHIYMPKQTFIRGGEEDPGSMEWSQNQIRRFTSQESKIHPYNASLGLGGLENKTPVEGAINVFIALDSHLKSREELEKPGVKDFLSKVTRLPMPHEIVDDEQYAGKGWFFAPEMLAAGLVAGAVAANPGSIMDTADTTSAAADLLQFMKRFTKKDIRREHLYYILPYGVIEKIQGIPREVGQYLDLKADNFLVWMRKLAELFLPPLVPFISNDIAEQLDNRRKTGWSV